MNEAEFKNLYLGTFEPNQRSADLHKRLELYYSQTPDSMSSKQALHYWREFKTWCREAGYSQKEIGVAKRHVRPPPKPSKITT